jgi:hypothetical protein
MIALIRGVALAVAGGVLLPTGALALLHLLAWALHEALWLTQTFLMAGVVLVVWKGWRLLRGF